MSTTDPKATVGGGRWMPFKNTGSESIPAYGVVEFDGTELINGAIVWKVKKPSSTATVGNIAFNGPTQVAQNAFGACTYDAPCRALYNDGGVALAVNDNIGPESSQWYLKKGNAGFVVVGGIDTSGGYCLIGKESAGLLRGVVVTTIAKGSSGSVQLYLNPEPIAAASVTVYATVTARAVYNEHFTGTKVVVARFGSQYHILGGEC